MKGRELADRIAQHLIEKKGSDILIMDLRGITSVTDYFVVCTAESEVQAKAMTEHVAEQLNKNGVRSWHVEGNQASRWILLDFIDVVVHIFQPEIRAFYNLERLWGDAKFIQVKDSDETSTLYSKDS
ncbi:ribosome silencing factor [candidate division KSB1 bacterium]|nr:ribosome silencing factor [candidate division KSB1 bacterium]